AERRTVGARIAEQVVDAPFGEQRQISRRDIAGWFVFRCFAPFQARFHRIALRYGQQSSLNVEGQPSLVGRYRRATATTYSRRWTSSLVSTNNHGPDCQGGLLDRLQIRLASTGSSDRPERIKIRNRIYIIRAALALLLAPIPATAQNKLVVSVWGGSWRDMVDNLIGKKYTAATGVPVEYITGGTIDRLNK